MGDDQRSEIQKIRADFVRDLVAAGFTTDEIKKIVDMLRFVAVLGASGAINPGDELGNLDLAADMPKAQAMVDALNRFVARMREATRQDG